MFKSLIHIITPLLLAMVVLYGISVSSFTVVSFYYHQKTITEKYCVNKDKPQLHCEGKCYLNAKLKEKSKQQQPKNTNVIREILWLMALVDNINNNYFFDDSEHYKTNDNYSNLYSFLFYTEIEHPPTISV